MFPYCPLENDKEIAEIENEGRKKDSFALLLFPYFIFLDIIVESFFLYSLW